MDLVNIRDLYREQKEYLEKEVMIGGWLRSKRDSKSFGFLVINDGTFLNRFRLYIQISFLILKQSAS